MGIIITNESWKQFENAVGKKLDKAMTDAVYSREVNDLFFVESDIITHQLIESPEWRGLTGEMRGEFGFTDAEIANIKGLEVAMAHDPRVTQIIKSGSVGTPKRILLKWVDFDALSNDPRANHPLTHWDGGWELTKNVNWIEWLEYGIHFHEFDYEPNPTKEEGKSRSGQGIMVPEPGFVWVFPPTQLFHNLPFKYNVPRFMKNIGIVLRKRLRQTTR